MTIVNGAATLLADLTRLGIRLEPRGSRLAYFPQSRMTPDLLSRLGQYKSELLPLLNGTPVVAQTPKERKPESPVISTVAPVDLTAPVSVIITCHNYARYLESAILSVLGQTQRPTEIIVVDDASTDHTKDVAALFTGEGVEYIRVEHRSTHLARLAGINRAHGEFVLFVDADNLLSREFIEHGLAAFDAGDIGAVYGNVEHFGIDTGRTNRPAELPREDIFRAALGDCSAIIRRNALVSAAAWDRRLPAEVPAQAYLYQKLARLGWKFRRHDGVLRTRTHAGQQHRRFADQRAEYFIREGLSLQDVTLFIPLAGRHFAWDRMSNFLQQQTWPHSQTHLILCDTSQNRRFSDRIRDWIRQCDYPDVRHMMCAPGPAGLAGRVRGGGTDSIRYLNEVMCRIANRLRATVDTEYTWILEDDVIPSPDVLSRLMRHFRENVGTVSAPYRSRQDGQYYVWDRDLGTPPGVHRISRPPAERPQTRDVRGTGFGCVVMRSDLLRKHIFSIPRGELCFDVHFFRTLESRWRRVCDWTCEAEHLSAPNSSPKSRKEKFPDPVWFRQATMRRSVWTLDELYKLVSGTFSDISEHCPTLKEIASQCEHVTELGTRYGISTVALLAGQPKQFVSCDLHRQPTIGVIESVTGKTDFRFQTGDSRKIDLDETDLLFIDTLHEYDQLRAELARHSGKVRKWIVLHDTESFRTEGEAGGRGLWPAVEEFVKGGQWRIVKHHENNNGLTVLERIVHTPGVSLITPTGDRPEAFALCVKWMQRQQCEKVGPLQWIIVDDGREPIDRSLLNTLDDERWTIRYIRREPQPKDPPHTLCLNMQLALPHIQHDKVQVIEDDDYYAPDYITTMSGWLDQADLVGEVGAKYYYLDSRSYYHFREHQHASWCRTGFRPSVIPTIWKEAARTNQWSLDLRVWEAWSGSKYRWIDESGSRALCIGIKGVPGRAGATWKTGRASYADPGLKQLRTWLGDDATDYQPLLTSRQRVKAPSAKVVVYTAIFDDYDRLLTDHVVNDGVKYVCFTDADIKDPGPWELRRVERTQKSGRRENRRYKLLSHRWFPDADYTIYFDGCSKLLIDPVDLVNYCESSDPHMARRNEAKLFTCRHPERDCLYAEADVCIRTRRDDPDTIRRQIERYRKEVFPEHAGLPHGGLLIRKRGCEFFNQCWWDEVMAGSCRDQISFPYAVRRSGVGHVLLPEPIEKFTERLRHAQPYHV